MAVATSIPRYDKNQRIIYNENELTLIEHIKNLRTSKKITKKKISNLIKQNDYWYSQIERSGKNGDDNRQRTIYKPDLINIISIVKYNANSISELNELYHKSECYLDKEIHAIPVTESIKKLEWYQINNIRTEKEQNDLFLSLSNSISKLLEQTYYSLASREDKDAFLNSLKEIKASMKIDPLFIILLAGQPMSSFLYEANEKTMFSLIKELTNTIDGFSRIEDNRDIDITYYFTHLKAVLDKYISDSQFLQRKKYEFLPDDEITF